MPHWLLKWAVHRTISVLPHRQKFNEFFQTRVTRTLELGAPMFERRLNHCRIHLENLLTAQPGLREFNALELGPGWYPTIAVGLYLCGANQIWLVDIDPLLKSKRLRRMMELFCEFDAQGKLEKCLPALNRQRFERLRSGADKLKTERAEEWLERWNIHVRVRDAQDSRLPPGTIDLFYSTGVLEYVPLPVLKGILKEFHRLKTAHAVMSHWIGLLDQMSFFDRSLSPYNYLRYTDAQWKLWSSPMIRQNRMTIPDYRQLFDEAGYDLILETNTNGSPEDLDRVPLAPHFRRYKREDLLILESWMVAKPRVLSEEKHSHRARELKRRH